VLQQQYAKRGRIDPHASLTSRSGIRIARPVDAVWALVADPEAWPSWAPHIRDVELDGGVAVDEQFTWSLGTVRIRATFAVVTPGRELSWTGRALWTRAIDRTVLTPAGDGGTHVVFEESLSGVLVPLLFTERRLRAQHDQWLMALRAAAERRPLSDVAPTEVPRARGA
jgi:hypothetical protein